MSRGLSKQQRRILAMLKTKKLVRADADRGYFSTQEVVTTLNPDYTSWSVEVEGNPWFSNKKYHIDYQKFDKIRMSIYRALRSLEKRNLIVSFTLTNKRFWAVCERLKEDDFSSMDGVKLDKERYETRSKCWKWGAFVRTLPKDLRLKYVLRIVTKEDMESIKKRWKEHCDLTGNGV